VDDDNKLISEASDGTYMFYCPGCKKAHGFNKTWKLENKDTQPTVSPSILTRFTDGDKQMRCHLFIQNGLIRFLGDSTHGLAGYTVSMEPFGNTWKDDNG
jgi:hypothetical protein